MGDHYFTDKPGSQSEERVVEFAFRGHALAFVTDAGTFSRGHVDPGSELLLSVAGEPTGSCADIGCGWGAIGLSLAKANPQSQWLLTDINERSADLACRNARQNGISNASVRVGDGLGGIDKGFVFIVTNPPIRAGKDVVYRFFAQAWERLIPGGVFLTVIRKQQGAPSAKAHLEELFGNCKLVKRDNGYHILKCTKEA